MEFMSAREAADKWGISQRRVAVLCSENRIDNATMVGNMWIIPTTAEKPIDARSVRYSKCDNKKVKPFLKWAGGKGQLLSEIKKYYPFGDGKIIKYAEPFVGGGAVLFDILANTIWRSVIHDINADLIQHIAYSYDIEIYKNTLHIKRFLFQLDTDNSKRINGKN
jgi:DNA adenine methylase